MVLNRGITMNRMTEYGNESSFDTLNNMMILLESSLFDVQVMIGQAAETLFEVMGAASVDIMHRISQLEGDETVTYNLNEVYFDKEEDIFKISTEENRDLHWHELQIPDQFEVVTQVHQKFVAEYKLAAMDQQEEFH